MRKLHDSALRKQFQEEWNLQNIFTDPDLPFHFYRYREGESLLAKNPLNRCVKFVLQGTFRIYTITPDGSEYVIFQGHRRELISQWHIGADHYQIVYADAVTPVVTAELLLDSSEERLMEDAKFLRFLLTQISSAYREFAMEVISQEETVEKRLISLLQKLPRRSFSGVEEMAKRLHCSRSQLQKALRTLVSSGRIQRTRKGCYQLLESDSANQKAYMESDEGNRIR